MCARSVAAKTRLEALPSGSPIGLREPPNQAHFTLQECHWDNLKKDGW